MELTQEEIIALIGWYRENRRTLPWRDTGNPYDVWLSEIMLQQTRVEFVKERFIRFKEALPDIASLSAVSEDDLMKLWEGMGYYSRARNLKKCAQVLMSQYSGALPADYNALLELPGIGPYTAGAIASIAYGIPVPAVDGNVLRVFARLMGDSRDIRGTEIRNDINACITTFLQEDTTITFKSDPKYVRDFTQAWMELGALVCAPNGQPHCEDCPLKNTCKAYLSNQTDVIPFRSALKARTVADRTIVVIRDGSRFLLRKRPENGLLAGLYEFPGYEGTLERNELIKTLNQEGLTPLHIKRLPDSRHIFSHVEWHMSAYEVQIENVETVPMENSVLLTKKELQRFAVPSAFKAYKEYYSWEEE